jgi:hypothetical protein
MTESEGTMSPTPQPAFAPVAVAPRLPPGAALYRRHEDMQAQQLERTRAILEVKASRAADPNTFLPRINKASRALAKVADERQGVAESYADQPWHNRLYDRSRKVYVADAYVEMGFEQLSVAEKAYLRNEQIERERGWVARGALSSQGLPWRAQGQLRRRSTGHFRSILGNLIETKPAPRPRARTAESVRANHRRSTGGTRFCSAGVQPLRRWSRGLDAQ